MTADFHKTLAIPGSGSYKEKGSRFLAYSFPVETEAEAKALLISIRKNADFKNACHICYAYKIGVDKVISRMNDDGEPSGTAGKPIFHVIEQHQLTNTLIAVVRFFGGVLLGTGPLAKAYKAAAEASVLHTEIAERPNYRFFQINYTYHQQPLISQAEKLFNFYTRNKSFNDICILEAGVIPGNCATFEFFLKNNLIKYSSIGKPSGNI